MIHVMIHAKAVLDLIPLNLQCFTVSGHGWKEKNLWPFYAAEIYVAK